MTASHHELVFEPLSMRRRTMVPVSPNQYRVLSPSGESRQVEATTAYEACKLSGFGNIIKIERLSNIEHIIVENSYFIDSGSSDPSVVFSSDVSGDDPFDRIKRRKNPVVTADELDSLMRALQEITANDSESRVPVETQFETAESEPITSIGKDVHGDGFDEIIPTAQHPVKPSVAKAAVTNEANEVKAAAENPLPNVETIMPVPEQELSQEEIEKLLSGK